MTLCFADYACSRRSQSSNHFQLKNIRRIPAKRRILDFITAARPFFRCRHVGESTVRETSVNGNGDSRLIASPISQNGSMLQEISATSPKRMNWVFTPTSLRPLKSSAMRS